MVCAEKLLERPRGGAKLSDFYAAKIGVFGAEQSFNRLIAACYFSKNPAWAYEEENLSVLEYINGGVDAPFALAEPWYAVNPIVRELQKFKATASTLS